MRRTGLLLAVGLTFAGCDDPPAPEPTPTPAAATASATASAKEPLAKEPSAKEPRAKEPGATLFHTTWQAKRLRLARDHGEGMLLFGEFVGTLQVKKRAFRAEGDALQGVIARIDRRGRGALVAHVKGDEPQAVAAVAAREDGSLAIAGHFEGTIAIGDVELKGGPEPMGYVALLAEDGSARWMKAMPSAEGKGPGVYRAVGFDETGDVWAVGERGAAMRLTKLSAGGEIALDRTVSASGTGTASLRALVYAEDGPVALGRFTHGLDLGLGPLAGGAAPATVFVGFDGQAKPRFNVTFGDGAAALAMTHLAPMEGGFVASGALPQGKVKLPTGQSAEVGQAKNGYLVTLDASGKPGWLRRWEGATAQAAGGPGGVAASLTLCDQAQVLPEGPRFEVFKKGRCNSWVLHYDDAGELGFKRELKEEVEVAIAADGTTYYASTPRDGRVTVGALSR